MILMPQVSELIQFASEIVIYRGEVSFVLGDKRLDGNVQWVWLPQASCSSDFFCPLLLLCFTSGPDVKVPLCKNRRWRKMT